MTYGTPFGRYELLRKIAAGGMAEIFLARQWSEANFFRDVVIKRLFRNLVESPSVLRMFHYEAHLLAHLTHPNIPQVYELGQHEGDWYVAMEYVNGSAVTDLCRAGLRNRQPMPFYVALGIVMQACEALHHAHEAVDRAGQHLGIVHRDVTPHNLMVTRDGVVKLMDFGVAKTEARSETEGGALKGTYAYMAPEQVRGRPLDRRADVFALGVILYELTTGRRLFRGTGAQVMMAIVENDVPPPTSFLPDYPADLEEIVLGALRRDRRGRIPSAAELTLHLEYFAMRHGLPSGPRSIADWIAQALPLEQVAVPELGLVDASRPSMEFEIPLHPPAIDERLGEAQLLGAVESVEDELDEDWSAEPGGDFALDSIAFERMVPRPTHEELDLSGLEEELELELEDLAEPVPVLEVVDVQLEEDALVDEEHAASSPPKNRVSWKAPEQERLDSSDQEALLRDTEIPPPMAAGGEGDEGEESGAAESAAEDSAGALEEEGASGPENSEKLAQNTPKPDGSGSRMRRRRRSSNAGHFAFPLDGSLPESLLESIAPAPLPRTLDGFETDEDEAKPVVLLDVKKDGKGEEEDYLLELERRLSGDEKL